METRTKGARTTWQQYENKGCRWIGTTIHRKGYARYGSMHSGECPNIGPGIVLVPVAGNDRKQSWLACNGIPYANGNAHTQTRKEDDRNYRSSHFFP